MEVCTPAQAAFYLTNSAEHPPIVHSCFEASTRSWQHIVADPWTKQCVIIDPVRDDTIEEVKISTQAADALLDIVRAHRYTVSLILATNSDPADEARSAAWYLRMQLMSGQASAPQIDAISGAVTALERLFERKYGAGGRLQSNHQDIFASGAHVVGRMRLRVVPIPGALTPRRRMYIIGPYVFGAHSLALGERDAIPADFTSGTSAAGLPLEGGDLQGLSTARIRDAQLYASMMQVLALPESLRLYFDCGSTNLANMTTRFIGDGNAFDTVDQCRNANIYLGLTEQEFIIRREGERQAAAEMKKTRHAKTKKLVTTRRHIPVQGW